MKILICESHFSAGGAERVVCNLANHLSKNHEVKVLSLTQTAMAYQMADKIDCECIDKKIYDKTNNIIINMYNKISKNILRLFKLKKQIKIFKPDVILSFLPEPSFLTLTLKKENIPVIISVRNDPKIEYNSKIYHYLMKKLYPKANGIVFQTDEAKHYFDKIVKCPTCVIPNPINPDFIEKPFEGERKKQIVSVGRLTEQKNQKMLIDAFYQLPKEYNDYKLIIYGEGNLREDLKKQIKKYNMENRIFLPGVVKNVKKEIYDSSLFIMTSIYEGMPNALMEAMALGLPVISTDCPCGGPSFLIKNDLNGILIPIDDIDNLKNAIIKVLSNSSYSKMISKNASEISKKLNPTKINDEWEKFIKSIVNKQR